MLINRNFFLIKNNFISKEDCLKIINLFKNNTGENTENGMNFYHLTSDEDLQKINFIHPKIFEILKEYSTIYPEIEIICGKKILTEFKFKHFKPGNFFSHWHSEHSYKSLPRVIGFTIYLSEHNCGTEFFDGTYIKSETGKVIIFPCYFTHTHKGQPCPENKDRYLLTAYVHSIKP
jgi:hypothetical protein